MSKNGHLDQVEKQRIVALASRRLTEAFAQGRLTLYLGAGCSVDSGVLSWGPLVMQLYVNGFVHWLPRFKYVPGLISAVGHWAFARQVLPLEVAARKLRGYYPDDSDLLDMIKIQLYGLTGYYNRGRLRPAEIRQLLAKNHTLRAISRICRETVPGKRGVRAVITYNYDDLLEKSLGRFRYQSVWRAATLKAHRLPIFHVHGYLPARMDVDSSRMSEVVLTEDQYNRAMQNPYSWQNLIQMHSLSGSIGLIVGLSLSDRNLRSLLDALGNLPERIEAYALLPRPKPWNVGEADVTGMVDEMKERIRDGLEPGYHPGERDVDKPSTRKTVVAMVRELEREDLMREEAMLAELGVHIIWYEEHPEIERLVKRLLPLKGRKTTD